VTNLGLLPIRQESIQNNDFLKKEIDKSGLPPVRLENSKNNDFLKKELPALISPNDNSSSYAFLSRD